MIKFSEFFKESIKRLPDDKNEIQRFKGTKMKFKDFLKGEKVSYDDGEGKEVWTVTQVGKEVTLVKFPDKEKTITLSSKEAQKVVKELGLKEVK